MARAKRTAEQLVKTMETAAAMMAPSMVPAFEEPEPPPAKEEPATPALKDVVKDKRDYLEMKRLIEQSATLAREMKPLKKQRDAVTERLKVLMGKHKIGVADLDNTHINYFSSSRRSINGQKLLAYNVSPATIAACTDVKEVLTLKITQGKEDEDE